MTKATWVLAVLIGVFAADATALAQRGGQRPPVASRDGELRIVPEANGDRLVDFSHAGYAGGGVAIPTVPAKVLVKPVSGDATAMIQAAIEQVGAMPADAEGFRGAVLLAPGTYEIHGQIRLDRSGVVLRGGGVEATTLLAAGYDRRPLIRVGGAHDRDIEKECDIADEYVPVGSLSFNAPGHGLKIGDSVIVTRPCTDAWTVAMGMDEFGGDRHGMRWNPDSRVLEWDRVVAEVDGDKVTLDATLTCSLEAEYGGGTVARYEFPGRVTHAGVENLTCDSTFDKDNPADEDHAWLAIAVDDAADVWVRRVDAKHFVSSAVAVQHDAKRVTVEDCRSLDPVGEIGGWRRRAFFVDGQQVLMQRLWSEGAQHDFAVGFVTAGPNAFVECESRDAHGDSGAIDSWAAGALFDRVRVGGGNLSLKNLAYLRQCAGWSACNSVLWNSSAGVIECWSPPMARNYAAGTRGEFSGDGVWWSSDDGASPDSLYYALLESRVGADASKGGRFVEYLPEGSRRSTPEMAARLVELSRTPQGTVNDLIAAIAKSDPLPTSGEGLDVVAAPAQEELTKRLPKRLAVHNGWLVAGGELVTGGQAGVPIWNSRLRRPHVSRQPTITRFVPGQEGPGFTDRLDDVAKQFAQRGVASIVQHPSLWYDRRRDDHQRVPRSDAEVVPPFYEWPFARSGEGRAYDGLSKWDLSKPNRYYYHRLNEFARHAAEHGLVLFNEHYLQHSILESGGHYADYPWRGANNVNDVGLPEPVAYAGDKLIYMGENFYDVANNAKLRAAHRQYIRTQLEQLKDAPNLVHLTSAEFTGSLPFVQFWLDTIAEWEAETGRNALAGLYAPKDVTDGILADAKRAKAVDVIYNYFGGGDMGFWYSGDKLWAPPGGQNMAPRQWDRLGGGGRASANDVVRMVAEYRSTHPDKAFAYIGSNLGPGAWRAVIAGMSMPNMEIKDADLARAIPTMKPAGPDVLADGSRAAIAFVSGELPTLPVAPEETYEVRFVDPRSGKVVETRSSIPGAEIAKLEAPERSPYVLWVEQAE
jgi:hypothetical protein